MSKKICIIGAGQLGSRHLQALRQVTTSLEITVVDPSDSSLKTAKERYEGIIGVNHSVSFEKVLPTNLTRVDVAIVATSANVRRKIVEDLIGKCEVKFLILEKLLFPKIEDYLAVSNILSKTETKTFVNCTMRMVPFYRECKGLFEEGPLTFSVNGSKYGLVTNSIHYLDLVAFYSNDTSFQLNSHSLDAKVIQSKRQGFSELNGTMIAEYSKGSKAIISCDSEGNLPVLIEIVGAKARMISREWENKAWISTEKDNWQWKEVDAKIPFQSQLTANLVNDLFSRGTCDLVTYQESSRIHLHLLNGLGEFLSQTTLNSDDISFT